MGSEMCIGDWQGSMDHHVSRRWVLAATGATGAFAALRPMLVPTCPLYTSDAADDQLCVDSGGRRIIKKKIT